VIGPSDLAHYARACTDIEYNFPWGKGEVEGVAHRGDYDLDVCIGPKNTLSFRGFTRLTRHTKDRMASHLFE
jgi:glycyl-tRNA synthetase (class II)